MLRRVQKYIRDHELLHQGDRVIVGVSGGADSVALLDVLLRGGYEPIVAHCNFHLRGEESNRDEAFVRHLITELGEKRGREIELHVTEFDTKGEAEKTGKSIEMAARDLRYEWFGKLVKECEAVAVAVAHHQNDQAETLLLNMKRCAGLRGMQGMRPKMYRGDIAVIRPLLCTTHDYIQHYLKDIRRISWVEDSTNTDTAIKRNSIRSILSTCSKSEIEHMAQTAEMVQGYVDWLDGKDTKGAQAVQEYEQKRHQKEETKKEEQKLKHFGIIGNPLKQSFSAKHFNEKFAREGIKAEYSLYPLERIEDVVELWEKVELTGMNVTIPYKISIIPYLDALDETAKEIQAVNVVKLEKVQGANGEEVRKVGYNTDALGFIDSIKPMLSGREKRAAVLGSGGASKAVQYGLRKLGLEVVVVSRKVDKSSTETIGYEEFHPSEYQVIVNATPVGMFPDVNACPTLHYEEIGPEHIVFDCIYNPEETEFIKRAKSQGAKTQNGMRMLIGQAEAAWKIWK